MLILCCLLLCFYIKLFKSLGLREIRLFLKKTKESTTFRMEGVAILFHIPVTVSVELGTGGSLELSVVAAGKDESVPLTKIFPEASKVPVSLQIVALNGLFRRILFLRDLFVSLQ